MQALTPVEGAESRYDEDGNEIVQVMTCGYCGKSWNDAAISSVTPVPAGRCPFEHEHSYPDDEPAERLEWFRAQLRAERISMSELIELQGMVEHIKPDDVELLEAAGVPEFPEDEDHHCPPDRIEDYKLVEVGELLVQVGTCVGCREIIARRYVITGPGTGPWTILKEGGE